MEGEAPQSLPLPGPAHALGCAAGLRLWVACPLGPSLGSRYGRPVGSEAAVGRGSPASAAGALPGGTQRQRRKVERLRVDQ